MQENVRISAGSDTGKEIDMRYCERNIKGGCYHELSRGDFARVNQYWRASSLFIDDDVFQACKLYYLFSRVIPDYDTWGINQITQPQWEQIKAESAGFSTKTQALLREIEPWVQESFRIESCFFILGV